MATRTWNGATNNAWGTAGNWAEGFVPTNADDVVFGTNVNCSVTATSVCKTIDFGSYSGTFTNTSSLTVSGNVTLGSSVTWGTFTGPIIVAATATLTSNGKDIPYLRFLNTITVTLADDWTVTENLYFPNSLITVTLNSNNIYVSGGTITQANGCTVNGTTTLHVTGTVNWTAGSNYISNPIVINTAGTFTLSNNFNLSGNTITWISGTMASSGSATSLYGNVTFTGTGLSFNNITALANTVLTLSNDITILGSISGHGSAATFVINGNNMYVGGGLSTGVNTTISGTTNIILNGTGTISTASSSGNYRNNIEINTAGTITISGTFRYSVGIFKYTTAGSIVATGSTFTIIGSATLDTAGMTFESITTTGAPTLTINSTLTASGTLLISATTGNISFLGTAGFSVNTFSCTVTVARTLTFKAGVTYTVTGSLVLKGVSTSTRLSLVSSTPTTAYYITLNTGATCAVMFVSSTDVDSSGGRLVTNVKGVLLRTVNWYITNPDYFEFF